jgi:hypothetical protein
LWIRSNPKLRLDSGVRFPAFDAVDSAGQVGFVFAVVSDEGFVFALVDAILGWF